jgi:hypothetical protein
VIPDVRRARASADLFGHDAIMWSSAENTYVLVSREPRETLERLASDMQSTVP